jgi:diguanylate cyclase (GGDEF)-like protein
VLAIGLLLSWFIGGRIISATRSLIKPAMLLGDGRMVRIRVVGLKEIDEVGKALALASEKLSTAQYKANHDNLTGLPNRALFYDVLASFMRISSRNKSALSLLFIDLDGFKKINDQFGHATGDELLRLVAARLILIVRASDITARLGGDEFAVALPDTTSEEAEIVANKIVQGLSSPYTVDLQNLQISASIGIAVASIHTLSVESLVRAADDAMYVAKAAGKARVHVGA